MTRPSRSAGLRWASALALGLLLAVGPGTPALAAEDDTSRSCLTFWREPSGGVAICVAEATFFSDVCRDIDLLAARYGLPEGYFARLIWQESRFDPVAVSPAGAMGIAQFMPGTARLRGLADAFLPLEALTASAEYLSFLAAKYGNLGLAAAAYNAGEARVSRWIANGGLLPAETRNYVAIVTGHSVDAWLLGDIDAGAIDYALQPNRAFQEACVELASTRPTPMLPTQSADWKPWGVLIAQDFSAAVAERRFRAATERYAMIADASMLMLTVRNPSFGPRPRHSAMIGKDSRAEAEQLCADLRKAGGSCVVVKN